MSKEGVIKKVTSFFRNLYYLLKIVFVFLLLELIVCLAWRCISPKSYNDFWGYCKPYVVERLAYQTFKVYDAQINQKVKDQDGNDESILEAPEEAENSLSFEDYEKQTWHYE